MIIDAKNMIAGRLATKVAKLALLGNTIDIINSDLAVISGNKEEIFASYKVTFTRGSARKGPFTPKHSDRLLKRIIRGMLPYKQEKGLLAFKRIKCYIGVPEAFQGKAAETIKEADISKVTRTKYATIGEIAKYLGGNR